MKRKFIVEIEVSKKLLIEEIRHYIIDAIAQWSQGGDPEGLLWDLEVLTVKRVIENKEVKLRK